MLQKSPLKRLAGGVLLYLLATTNPTVAQVIPDATLPTNSIVTPQGNTSVIEGGTKAGGNLFHSFQEFSIPTGGTAFFNNPLDVQNILTRVTGRSISNIDGLLRANGTANLFLINPNGIIFGPNASLNIGGSFLASTASSLKFADGTEFSAINPQNAPLITVSVPLGLQFPGIPASIVNQSRVSIPGNPQPVGLAVQPGQTIALVGGDITQEGGYLTAQQGRIELGSVGANSLVSLNSTPNGWTLGYNGVQNFGNIQLSQSGVEASGSGGGNIQVQGGRVTLTNGSRIGADTLGNQNGGGIEIQARQLTVEKGAFISASTFGGGNAGNLTVRATDSVELTGDSNIGDLLAKIFQGKIALSDLRNGLFTVSFGAGASGNLTIETGNLIAQNGAVASTSTLSAGQGGNLTVTTPANGAVKLSNAGLLTGTAGNQNSGNLTVNTGRLIIDATGVVASPTLGAGAAGNLSIKAAESVELTGDRSIGDLLDHIFQKNLTASDLRNGLFTVSLGAGASGNLTIETPKLIAQNGAVASTTSFLAGKGGNLEVNASDSVRLVDAGLLTGTAGAERSGDLTITTGQLLGEAGAVIAATTLGSGDGGNIKVSANTIELTGTTSRQFTLLSPLFTQPQTISTGLYTLSRGGKTADGQSFGAAAGDITIETGKLYVRDGAVVTTTSLAGKSSGNLTVNATELIEITGKLPETKDLQILEEILNGDAAGNPKIDPFDVRSGLFTSSFGGGAGNLFITTPKLTIGNGGVLSASTFGEGSGGDLTVTTPPNGSVELTGAALLTGTTGSQKAGNLTIDTGYLRLQEGAIVTTATLRTGAGGNVTVKNAQLVELTGLSTETYNLPIFVEQQQTSEGPKLVSIGPQQIPSSLLTLTFGAGNAGNLEINTNQLKLQNGAAISTSTLGTGRGGDLTVRAPSGLVEITGQATFEDVLKTIFSGKFDPSDVRNGLFTSSFGAGQAGNLTIETGQLIARNGATISASTFIAGLGGNLTINAPGGSIEINDAGLLTGTAVPQQAAGNLNINTGRLIAENGSVVATSTLSSGQGGNLNVTANSVELIGASADGQVPSGLFTLTFGLAKAGDLTVNTNNLMARNGGLVAASTFSNAQGGNLTVNASESIELKGGIPPGGQFPSSLRADAPKVLPGFAQSLPIPPENQGNGTPGNLTIDNTGALIVRDGAEVVVNAGKTGNGGNISITADTIAVLPDSRISANGESAGGKITIITQGLFAVSQEDQITATAQTGISGPVEVITPDIQSNQTLVDVPQNVVASENQVAQVCATERGRNRNQFIITGRGGLPPSPTDPLSSNAVRVSEGMSRSENSAVTSQITDKKINSPSLPRPATGWFVNAKGEVVFTANAPNFTPQGSLPTADCHAR